MSSATDQPLVTVVIPAFNAARFLAETLRSAAVQTHANLQILVVNDGSTDGTAEIVAAMAASDRRIELYSKSNGGLSAARNDGIRRARGDYVAFLDADDLWHPDKITRQLQAMRDHPQPHRVGAVYVLSREIDEADRWLSDYPRLAVQGRVLCRHLLANFVATGGSNLLCPTPVALEVGGFDISYQAAGGGTSEDYDFQLKVAAHYDIVAVEQYLVGYRRYPGSMSGNQLRMASSRRSVIERHLEVNGIAGRCRRWALGGVDVVECGAYLASGRPLAALGAAWRLGLGDPGRLIWEVCVRLPRALAARLVGRRKVPGAAFGDLDPNKASPARAPGLLLARLRALEADNAP